MLFKRKYKTLMLSCTIIILGFDNSNNEKYWINNKYINCLKSSLPCECEQKTKPFFYFVLDTNKKSNSFGANGLTYYSDELEHWNIRKIHRNIYSVFNNIGTENIYIGTAYLKEGKLVFKDSSGEKSSFSNYPGSNTIVDFQYQKQNVILINKSFIKRGYSTLEKILGDSLNCFCNKELGVVSSPEKSTF